MTAFVDKKSRGAPPLLFLSNLIKRLRSPNSQRVVIESQACDHRIIG